jgi:2-polyprenyl-6-hydroxyphenyl methylase/3-demethylubiquinone-9 3-methyltransferase
MDYYSEKLGGLRLQKCYDIAPARVKQYLAAEINFVLDHLEPESALLELGCGYGRVTLELAKAAGRAVGIDTCDQSVFLARELAGSSLNCEFFEMDALNLHFPDKEFDAVVCVQNGICAFGVDKTKLVREALRVTRNGGRVMFSSYSEQFWPHRLEWFQLQARQGLVGEIDFSASGEGTIVCKDGLRLEAMGPEDFLKLCEQIGVEALISEIDGSSVFCEIVIPYAEGLP